MKHNNHQIISGGEGIVGCDGCAAEFLNNAFTTTYTKDFEVEVVVVKGKKATLKLRRKVPKSMNDKYKAFNGVKHVGTYVYIRRGEFKGCMGEITAWRQKDRRFRVRIEGEREDENGLDTPFTTVVFLPPNSVRIRERISVLRYRKLQ